MSFIKGVAIDPTCINIGRLDLTEPNLVQFNSGSWVNRHSLFLMNGFLVFWGLFEINYAKHEKSCL